jgi:NTE family protein
VTVRRRAPAVALAAALLLGACASPPVTPPLERAEPGGGYRFATHRASLPGDDPETLLILTFSGGGTRAAALAYGVLEELRRTPARSPQGAESTALAQVDLVTGTSGGSFTALAYALYGERLFGIYEEAFLKRNVQGELIDRLLDPLDWPRLLSRGVGRSELAEAYYDQILFKGATFADLRRQPTPFALAGATDVSTGARIDFAQLQFDAMCIDLDRMPLSRAAAASSAVPAVLSPVTLQNRGGTCGFQPPAWMVAAARVPREQLLGNRAGQRLQRIELLGDSQRRPYIHLVDGGLSDNLGLVSVVQVLQEMMDSPALRAALRGDRLRRVGIVMVNARSSPSFHFDQQPFGPSTVELLIQSVRLPMNRYSTESVAALNDVITEWRQRAALDADARRLGLPEPPGGALPDVAFFVVDVSFDAVSDPALRSQLQTLPTSFALPAEAVDRLRDTGARLLRESPAFRAFLASLAEARKAPVSSTQ